VSRRLEIIKEAARSINEGTKIPKEMKQFVDVAKKSKNGSDFFSKAQAIKGIHPDTSDWFFTKYNPSGSLSMQKAADAFLLDVKNGVYSSLEEAIEAGNAIINEAKGWSMKGKMKTLKSVADLGDGIGIIGLSRDTNGNQLMRLEVGGKKKSLQYTQTGMSNIDIEELVNGDFMKRRPDDVKEIKRLAK